MMPDGTYNLAKFIMELNKINSICVQLSDKIDSSGLVSIKSSLEKLDDSKYESVLATISNLKDPTTILLLSLFLGQFGVDRFLLGKIGSGICKLIFGWLTFGIWWLVDVIKAKDNTKKYNSEKMTQALLSL